MPVATLTEFPRAFAAGDTVRVDISDADYPSGDWDLVVYLSGKTVKSFAADSAPANAYELVLEAVDTAKLAPGTYGVTFVYTSGNYRISIPQRSVQVVGDPAKPRSKGIARQTLEAMEAGFLKLVSAPSGSRLSVNFVGQSFTNRNLKEFQEAIATQRKLADDEDAEDDLLAGNKRSDGIHIRFA